MTRQIPLKSFDGTRFKVAIQENAVDVAGWAKSFEGRRRVQTRSASDAPKPRTPPRPLNTRGILSRVANHRVLIVDDDASVRESLGKVLKRAGYEVTTAADGDEAATQFVPEQVDLVLLDLNLPFRSGWDVFERLTTQHPTTPLIIITGMPNQYQTALAAGVGALMEKPIDAPALLRIMDELIAEPAEARLRRMCGYYRDTRHFRPPSASGAGHLHPAPIRFRRRRGVPRWREVS